MLIQKKNPKTIYKFLSSYHQIGDLIMTCFIADTSLQRTPFLGTDYLQLWSNPHIANLYSEHLAIADTFSENQWCPVLSGFTVAVFQ